MKEFKVLIPDECYQILEFNHEDLPGVAVVNSALKKFEPKEVFGWHLSVTLDLIDLIENGMPSADEVKVIDTFGDYLNDNIKGSNKERPNGLFLARMTWNKTRELIWRINDPELADSFLNRIISNNSAPRQFEFRMESDEEWKLTKWHLSDWT